MKQIAYKIRNKETGEFSKGGTSSVWTNRGGKTWSTIGALKLHLNQFLWNGELRYDYPYENAEIVEVEINFDDCFTYAVGEMIGKLQESKKKQAEDWQEKHRRWEEKQELELLAKLEKKYRNK